MLESSPEGLVDELQTELGDDLLGRYADDAINMLYVRDDHESARSRGEYGTDRPENSLHAQMEVADTTIDLWNIRAVPGSGSGEAKVKILEHVYNWILKGCEPPCILTGGFHAPARERPDGTTISTQPDIEGPNAHRWDNAEQSILTGLVRPPSPRVFGHDICFIPRLRRW